MTTRALYESDGDTPALPPSPSSQPDDDGDNNHGKNDDSPSSPSFFPLPSPTSNLLPSNYPGNVNISFIYDKEQVARS